MRKSVISYQSSLRKQAPRIALVSNSSWYTWNFRLGLLRRLRELGAEVYVISPPDHYSTKLIAEGFHFVHLPIAVYGANPFSEWLSILRLIRIYKQYRLDFVFHYTAKPNVYGSIAAWWCGVPSIAIATGLGMLRDSSRNLSWWALLSLYKIASLLCSQLWFLNADDREFFLRRKLVAPRKTFVLPSEGVNIAWYRPAGKAHEVQRPLRFLYAGRMVWSKGLAEFYQAARHFHAAGQGCSFHLVGFVVPDHPDAVSYDLIQKWQAQGIVRFHGETEDIRPYLAEADCVILPSFFGEGVPRILLEAAAMGKPIITTDFTGCREVVEHGVNGLLCRPRDAESLISAIEAFLCMPQEERRRMGWEGRKKVLRKFDEEIVIRHYLDALRQFLGWPAHKKKTRAYS